MQHKYRKFFNFSTRAFNYYKLKCGEGPCIAHELRIRAKVVNIDITYLSMVPVEKFAINTL